MMKIKEIARRYPLLPWFLAVAGFVAALTLACFFYFYQLRGALEAEVRGDLEEVARQGVKILQTQIDGDFNSLKSMASAIADFDSFEEGRMMRLLEQEAANNSFKRMAFIRSNGFALLSDGLVMDASKQETFLRGMEGENSLSNRFSDGTDGKQIIVQAVPVKKDGKVKAVLTATRAVDLYADVLSVYSFGGAGYNVIVRADGDRVVNARHETAVESLDNIFEAQEEMYWESARDVSFIRREMAAGNTFSVQLVTRRGGRMYASFVPVGVNDWYMVSLVPETVLHVKTSRLLALTLAFCALGLMLVSLLLFYILAMHKSNRAALARLAYEDPVTGYPNWRQKEPEIRALLRDRPDQPYALVTLDVDRFKVITNLHGVKAGDELLRRIARILASHMTEGEEFSRMEVDRFQMLLKYENEGSVRNRLQRINEEIVNFKTPGKDYARLLLSFGVYVITDRNLPVVDMISRSFLARRTVKYSVDVVAFFDEEMIKKTNFEKQLEDGMEGAFARGEFKLRLIPVQDLQTGKIVRALARIYWEHPAFGPLPGYVFRSVFERNGFALRVDRFLMEEVFKLAVRLDKEGVEFGALAVNLSPLHAYNPYYASALKKQAEQYGVPPSRVELGLAQETGEHQINDLALLASRLRAEGFRVGIHHFGEGLSAVEFLSRVKVDCLTVRLASITGYDEERTRGVLHMLANAAESLGCMLEFTGVQTPEDLTRLQETGMRYAAGPLWGEPLSPDEFLASLR